MAVSESKELIQCLAFAYFAENPSVDKEHEQEWYDIFDPRFKVSKTALKSKYGKYLSTNFDYDRTLKEHLSEVFEKGTIKKNPRLIKVYLVAKKLVDSNILKTSLNQYKFLDQNDKFVQTIKDSCLDRIAKTLKLSLKPDILSPSDLFFVKANQQKFIEKEFITHVLKVSDEQLLENMSWEYGVILCNARAMGEFGAVSVVSGHIRGETNTMPLQVEILYNEYNFAAAFAVASLLALLALVTLALKTFIEWRIGHQIASTEGENA